jgi:hypothetical protein
VVAAFRDAIVVAEVHQLPHQIQRTIRAAREGELHDVANEATDALARMNRLFEAPTSTGSH